VQSTLPITGTVELLERLSDFIPDEFINGELAFRRYSGQRRSFAPAQLWRTHLLAFLTSAHSFNAVVRLLPEQRAWRRFARLPQCQHTPDVRMLHEFRRHAGVTGLRAINDHLVRRLLKLIPAHSQTVAIIDATDLPAATADKKKTEISGRRNGPPWGRERARPATPNFMLGSKSIRCASGCGHIDPQSC
jgi:hypothetical protein